MIHLEVHALKLFHVALGFLTLTTGLIAMKSNHAVAVDDPAQSDTRTYSIVKADGVPNWNEIPELSADNILWEPDCGIRAFGQFCHDDSNLYVHLRAVEKDIRAEYTAPLSPVFQDSCLEFFFMPEGGDRYFNFEINPNGCLYVEFGHSRSDRFIQYRTDMYDRFDIRASRTDDGWEVFYRIPLDFIRLYYPDFTFSGSLRANIYKCGDMTPNKHYLSWNPVTSEKPDFHRPEDFGEMIFSA